MAQKKINYGAAPNDGTGDLYRVAMIKIDDNFTDLYTLAEGLEERKVAKTTTLAITGGATAAATALTGSAISLNVTSLDMSKASETLAVAHGGTGVTTSTGTGANVQADSPALVGTPTTPLPGAGAADDQVANVKYVKDGLSFKANSEDVTTALALKADKAYVDTNLALKVDKDGNKVLSDNNFTNDERIKLANVQAQATKNLPDATLLERSNHYGTQAIGTIDGLEARLQEGHRVMGITATDLKDFILQMHAYGPGYYRCESQIEGLPRFAAGLFTAISGTFTFVAADYVSGQPFVISGASVNVAAGAWNYIEPGNRAQHFGTQAINTVAGLDDKLDEALRVRVLNEPTMTGFLNQMWNLGPGYYRNDGPGLAVPQYSSGFFSKASDTWTFVCAGFSTGTPVFFSGSYSDIDANTWKSFTFGSAATRNMQSNPNDDSLNKAMVVGAFGLGKLNQVSEVNLDDFAAFPAGTSFRYVSGATNGPFTNFYGYLTVEKVDNQNLVQTLKSSGTGVTYRRVVSTGTGPWLMVHDASTVVGSMSGGAIIETGTNSNGVYTKFADGTLICYYRRGWDSAYAPGTAAAPSVNFAAQFVGSPAITANGCFFTGTNLTGDSIYGLLYGYGMAGRVFYSMLNTGHKPALTHPTLSLGPYTANSFLFEVIAIGRWK